MEYRQKNVQYIMYCSEARLLHEMNPCKFVWVNNEGIGNSTYSGIQQALISAGNTQVKLV